MEENNYKLMGGVGAFNLVLGIIAIIAGVGAGVMLIISAAKLFSERSKILF